MGYMLRYTGLFVSSLVWTNAIFWTPNVKTSPPRCDMTFPYS